MARLDSDERFTLGRYLNWREAMLHRPLTERELTKVAQDRNLTYRFIKRVRSHYRVFCRGLGFGPEVFRIPQERLDKLSTEVDWNKTEQRIMSGLYGKLNARQARAKVRGILESL